MSWIFLTGLGIIWAVCVFPLGRGNSPTTSVENFERGMDLLAETGRAEGRWIVAPRKGVQFVGPRNRARMRARQRRRRVFFFLLEVMGLTLLMALFPPLRPMIYATAVFGGLLVAYVVLLLAVGRHDRDLRQMQVRVAATAEAPGKHYRSNGHDRYMTHVSNGNGHSKPTYNGLGFLDEDEVHVVVHTNGNGNGHYQSAGVH